MGYQKKNVRMLPWKLLEGKCCIPGIMSLEALVTTRV